MRQATEHEIQSAFFEWVEIQSRLRPIFGNIFAIPNGGYRHPTTARKLKAEGVKAGVPDVFVAIPRYPLAGLFIEFKRPGAKPRPNQITWRDKLTSAGFAWRCVSSLDEAIEAVTEHME